MSALPSRPPALAGRFYPADPTELQQLVHSMLPSVEAKPALAVVAPHAGYVYSGAVAGQTLAQVEITETVVILCPKHTRLGQETSLLASGYWDLPGGGLSIDRALATHLQAYLPAVTEDPLAHRQEHAIEVLLPFLRELRPDVRFVPIAMGFRSHDDSLQFGLALGKALREWPQPVLLISSSDMNHFEDLETTLAKDQQAIDRVLALDPEGLYETCRRDDISMCGVVPTTAVLYALQAMEVAGARLVVHTTSAAISGDQSRVVGYAGMIID